MSTEDCRARRWAAAYAERPRLLRIARRRTASEAEAEDCVSEAMLRAVEFEGLDEDRMAAFLTTVTLRLCADQHRGRARLARVGGQLLGTTEEPSPEDGVCDRAEARWLVESLRGMSAHQRRVVAARAEGLSCDDVARRLGVSVDAVKSAVARVRGTARATLAKTLGVTPIARWSAALSRRSGGEIVAGGAFATAVGVTLSGLLLVPAAPVPAGGEPVPAVAREARTGPVHETWNTVPNAVGAAVSRAAAATDVFVLGGDDHYRPGDDFHGAGPVDIDEGPVTVQYGPDSMEHEIRDCIQYGVNVLGGDIRCNDEEDVP